MAEREFRERLWAPWWWWVLAVVVVALLGAEIHLGLGRVAAVVTYVVLGGAVAAFLIRWSTSIEVSGNELRVGGKATVVPVDAIVEVRVIDQFDIRAVLAAEPAADAVVRVKGYIGDAVHIRTAGGDLPSYLLLSTRRPGQLASALGHGDEPKR